MKGVKPLILASIVAMRATVQANDLNKVIDKAVKLIDQLRNHKQK